MTNVTIIVATSLSTAAATQLVVALYESAKRRRENREIEQLITTDLREMQVNLGRVVNDFNKLKEAVHIAGIDPARLEVYTEFTREVFLSVPLTVLHKVYGKRVIKLIRIYQCIEYLNQNQPHLKFEELKSKFDNGNVHFLRWFEKYGKESCELMITTTNGLNEIISEFLLRKN